ncbi:MAG: ChaN family lipoprotein [Pseudomonadota bacterium]
MTSTFAKIVSPWAALIASAAFCVASPDWDTVTADVVILGEYHDNPAHHAAQAAALTALAPTAVIYEMLTPDEASSLADAARSPVAMRDATQDFDWSNIADYSDVLAGSPIIVGAALTRAQMRGAFTDGAAAIFGDFAGTYGLTTALPEDEQTARENMQFDSHCEAMPLAMMGGMVEAQRLRDAHFARTVFDALDRYGAPVVLITGNGHARTDWGVPVYLAQVRPDLTVLSLGQGEGGTPPPGSFDHINTSAPIPDRADPCAIFSQ